MKVRSEHTIKQAECFEVSCPISVDVAREAEEAKRSTQNVIQGYS